MKNRKGFTLIELLAVIVILAILMVAAGTAVINTMNNAKVNTFKDEALQVIDSAKMMYTDISMSNTPWLITSHDKKNKAMCVTLNGLTKSGYLEKELGSNYKGVVVIEVPINSGETKYTVWMTNGTYGIYGSEKKEITGLNIKNEGIITDNSTKSFNSRGVIIAEGIGTSNYYTINSVVNAAESGKITVIYTDPRSRSSYYYSTTNSDNSKNYISCINDQI